MGLLASRRPLAAVEPVPVISPDDDELEVLNAVKVISISVIVFGNTYYYTMSGPLRNLNIISEWMSNFEFMWVVWADLQVDVFFWVTGFILSY